ncbi:KH domain-containing protein [Micractinium conductrix]|uniref:KH domain-containing protein n=1 Tax=Micractinium conductrix TaxID=554055 RepID=A0A2P6VGK7_9CHLO|nr:KH domain-containing protein [Micractinium conductrix]|eukprot:PSC73232.1 KH domain-containing protein [Micractinium conductrix]
MDGRGQNGTVRPESVQGSDEGAPALRLRLLCPHSLVPALIGKKGDNVKRICRDTGAAISVAEPVHGCDERVVHITGESVDDEGSAAADALVAVFESICSAHQAGRGGDGGSSRAVPTSSLSAPSPPVASPRSDGVCSASACGSAGGSLPDAPSVPSAAGSSASTHGDALMAPAGPLSSGPASIAASNGGVQQRPVEARLLVDSALVGYLVGRGGNTIKETMAKSGAGVRVLPKSDLPPCGCVGDEVVRACGSAGAVAAALRLLAGQIKAHPLRLGGLLYGGTAGRPPLMLAQATHADLAYIHPSLGGYFAAGPAAPGVGGLMGGHMGHAAHGGFSGTAVEVTFRMLAPVVRTGNIIGKGGEHVRRVRQETGARIKVFDPAPGSEERVVALSSSEDALSPYCAAQDALIRCVIALTAVDASAGLHRVRLLTAQASVGMVLGKRGATVSQLRQETGATIKVLPADLVPPAFGGAEEGEAEPGSASSGTASSAAEEVVQVEGSVQQCVAALRGVATLLRGWQIRRLMWAQQQQYGGGAGGHAAAATMQLQMPQQSMAMSPNGGGMMSPSSPGLMLPSTLGSPMQPSGYMMMQLPPGMMGPPPGHGMGGAPPHHVMQQRPVQYYYHLDNAQVGAVLGKGGSHIGQCRGVSGARVQLQGETEGGRRMLFVAGQPEQCHTAHSMINSFLSMGHCDPAYPEPAHAEPVRLS